MNPTKPAVQQSPEPERPCPEGWRAFLSSRRTPVELLAGLWRSLRGRDTPFSRLAQLGTRAGVPLEEKSSKAVRGDELLPINPQAVLGYLQP